MRVNGSSVSLATDRTLHEEEKHKRKCMTDTNRLEFAGVCNNLFPRFAVKAVKYTDHVGPNVPLCRCTRGK